jgi:hypothetical protein
MEAKGHGSRKATLYFQHGEAEAQRGEKHCKLGLFHHNFKKARKKKKKPTQECIDSCS